MVIQIEETNGVVSLAESQHDRQGSDWLVPEHVRKDDFHWRVRVVHADLRRASAIGRVVEDDDRRTAVFAVDLLKGELFGEADVADFLLAGAFDARLDAGREKAVQHGLRFVFDRRDRRQRECRWRRDDDTGARCNRHGSGHRQHGIYKRSSTDRRVK